MPVPVRELFDFQKAAVYRAIKRLDEYGGVIIADVVGTGKSFIGSAIMKHLRETKRSKPAHHLSPAPRRQCGRTT